MAGMGQFLKNLSTASLAFDANRKSMAKLAIGAAVGTKVLGPFYDLFKDAQALINGVSGLLGESEESMDEFGDTTEKATVPLSFFGKLLTGIKLALIVLGGVFLGTLGILALFAGSIEGATALLPGFFDNFGRLKDAVMDIGGSLKDVGKLILNLDFSPVLEPLAALFMGVMLLISDLFASSAEMFASLFALFAETMTYLSEVGALQSIIDTVGYVGEAFFLVFSIVFTILDTLGINFGSIFGLITTIVSGFVGFLISSGLLVFFIDAIELVASWLPVVVTVIGGILILLAQLIAFLSGPIVESIKGSVGYIVDILTIAVAFAIMAIKAFFLIAKGIWDFWGALAKGDLSGAWDIVVTLLGKLGSIWGDFTDILWSKGASALKNIAKSFTWLTTPLNWLKDKMMAIFGWIWDLGEQAFGGLMSLGTGAIDAIIGAFETLVGWVDDLLNLLGVVGDVLGEVAGGVGDAVGGFVGGVGDFLGFSAGGVARGPSGGYSAMLHGTEAVVPLPDGRTIPVTIRGGMGGGGGDNITLNISVSGSGNAREIANAVSEQVQRAFRRRSRSGGYGRGVI